MESKDKQIESKNVAVYLRVSSRDQAIHGYGLDAQEKKCMQYVALEDYDPDQIRIYKDDGYSAKSLERPMMQKLLQDVRKGRIKKIIVYKLDRVARSVIDTYNLIQELIDNDCQLVAIVDHFDINSANGRMIVGVLAVFAQWEREVIIERTKDGLREMVSKGKYPYGLKPFGWDKDKDKYLFINQKEADIIIDLGNQSLDGLSLIQIKKYLKDTYGISRDEATILKWLTRPINIGLFEYQGITYTNIVPAIMTEERFNRVKQSIGRHISSDKNRYLFHGKVYCECGAKCMQRSTNKKSGNKLIRYYYYECPTCKKRINETKLLDQVMIGVVLAKNKKNLKKSLKLKNKELEILRLRINEIYQKYVNDEINISVYVETMNKLKKKQDQLNKEILALDINKIDDFIKAPKTQKTAYIKEVIRYLTVDLNLNIVTYIEYK